jgi:hypothetical protein
MLSDDLVAQAYREYALLNAAYQSSDCTIDRRNPGGRAGSNTPARHRQRLIHIISRRRPYHVF